MPKSTRKQRFPEQELLATLGGAFLGNIVVCGQRKCPRM